MIKKKILICISLLALLVSCNDFPVDEDGLLITTRTECYVANFNLLDSDLQTAIIGNAYIDTTAQVVVAYVKYGTSLKNLWPQISLCEDAKLNPKITGWTDFSSSKMDVQFQEGDWNGGVPTEQLGQRIVANPADFPADARRYSVISGTRTIQKEYVFLIVERPKQ